jgi:hypothetical protein
MARHKIVDIYIPAAIVEKNATRQRTVQTHHQAESDVQTNPLSKSQLALQLRVVLRALPNRALRDHQVLKTVRKEESQVHSKGEKVVTLEQRSTFQKERMEDSCARTPLRR